MFFFFFTDHYILLILEISFLLKWNEKYQYTFIYTPPLKGNLSHYVCTIGR